MAAVVAVAGLSASLRDGIRREARQLLAADLAVRGNQPLPPEVLAAITDLPGARRTDVKETVTVAAAPARNGQPGPSQLVELKVIDGVYPFYGKLDLRPQRPLNELLTPDTAVVASDLLAHLGLQGGRFAPDRRPGLPDRRHRARPSPTGSASRSPSARGSSSPARDSPAPPSRTRGAA